MANYLRYANQGATRNQPLSDELVRALAYLEPMGITAEVFSGGQPSSGPNRVGSHRHDHGQSGDIRFYKDGKPISWANEADLPLFREIVSKGKAAGITGFGAGPGYMGEGTMHIGFGSPSVWGAGGKGANAPAWLREAFNGGGGQETKLGGVAAPPDPYASMPDGPKGQETYAPPQEPQGDSLLAGIQAPMQEAGQGILGEAGMNYLMSEDRQGKSRFEKSMALLARTPNAPEPNMGGMGDARASGDALLKVLMGPTYADMMKKRRLG